MFRRSVRALFGLLKGALCTDKGRIQPRQLTQKAGIFQGSPLVTDIPLTSALQETVFDAFYVLNILK